MEKQLAFPKIPSEIRVPCNLCGSREFSVKYRPTKTNVPAVDLLRAVGFIRGAQQIVQCRNCRLVYVNPRLDSDFIEASYQSSECEEYLHQFASRKLTFARSLNFLETYRPDKGKLLDVGCAAGLFLSVAQEKGWEINGVEICRWLAEKSEDHCRPYIKTATLQEAHYPDEHFDVVTLWDVLEHLMDPKATLIEIHRILKRGGLAVINLPDIDSLTSKLTRSRWWHLISIHFYYFSSTTLTKMLEETGFSVIARTKHLQTLQLGYLVSLLKMYHRNLERLASFIVKLGGARLETVPVTFSSGETTLIARKD